ncbi:metal ABC transporter solute-binding protein, Zn/Mn family [Natronospora cellulosivora (SeqCode)]
MFKKKALQISVLFLLIIIISIIAGFNVLARTPEIYVSVYPIYDIANAIAGHNANVSLLVPSGTEMHGFEPSPRQLAALERADIFFYIGLGLETWAEKAVDSLERLNVETIKLSDGLDLLKYEGHDHVHHHEDCNHDHGHHHEDCNHDHGHHHEDCNHDHGHHHEDCNHDHGHHHEDCNHDHGHHHEDCNHDHGHHHEDCNHEHGHHHEDCNHDHGHHHEDCNHDHGYHHEDCNHEHGHHHDGCGHLHGEYDPHVWLDPMNMIEMAGVIKEKLISIDPDNLENYNRNYNNYVEELYELDREFQKALSDMHSHYIMVSHAAFGYLGERYGIKQLSVTGLSSHAEPSPGNIAKLIREAKEHNINYIFMETLASPRTVEVIAEEADLEVLTLNPLEGLTAAEEEKGEDYFSIMRKNLANLVKDLTE